MSPRSFAMASYFRSRMKRNCENWLELLDPARPSGWVRFPRSITMHTTGCTEEIRS